MYNTENWTNQRISVKSRSHQTPWGPRLALCRDISEKLAVVVEKPHDKWILIVEKVTEVSSYIYK